MILRRNPDLFSENIVADHLSEQAIYGVFYGLTLRPFDLTPDPRFLFLTPRQREAVSNLQYGLTTPRGFALLIGEAGTGKTTLVQAVLAQLRESPSKYVSLSNPTLNRGEFYEHLARAFGLSEDAALSKTRFLSELGAQVQTRSASGGLTGLIVDEAQSLPYELLEEIRLLGNVEAQTTKLLNIVLAGQPELADRLNEPSLRQLKQRISLRCELATLDLQETGAYIAGRLRVAGGSPAQVFTREAVIAIHRLSRGVPRTINVICDNALIWGFAEQLRPIPVRIAEEVGREFDLGQGSSGLDSRSSQAPAPTPAPDSRDANGSVSGDDAAPMFEMHTRKRRFSFF